LVKKDVLLLMVNREKRGTIICPHRLVWLGHRPFTSTTPVQIRLGTLQ
jgi:hypothetical protein